MKGQDDLRDLYDESNRRYRLKLGDRLGGGAGGKVHAVDAINGETGTGLAIKFLNDSRARVDLMIQTFLGSRSIAGAAALRGLPFAILRDINSHAPALLMRRVSGAPFADDATWKRLDRLGVASRLELARQLAVAVDALHTTGIVAADLAPANVLIDIESGRLYVIDVEAGGFFEKAIYPTVDGHSGTALAPELRGDDGQVPGMSSDVWSLAVLLHRLVQGVDPFNFCETQADVSDELRKRPAGPWPPPALLRKIVQGLDYLLGALGFRGRWGIPGESALLMTFRRAHTAGRQQMPEITSLFACTFGAGRGDPGLRPSAGTFAAALDRATRWLYHCPRCRKSTPFVAWNRSRCPRGHRITHAVLRTDRGHSQEVARDCEITVGDLLDETSSEPALKLRRTGAQISLTLADSAVACGTDEKRKRKFIFPDGKPEPLEIQLRTVHGGMKVFLSIEASKAGFVEMPARPSAE